MIYFLTLFCFLFSGIAASDFYERNASISVLPFGEDITSYDIYTRPFIDAESKFPRYFFQLQGFPKDEEITISIQRIAQKEKGAWLPIYKFLVKSSGMIIADGSPIGFMLYFSSQGCLPGERIGFLFETESGFREGISFIPNPLVCKNTSGNILAKAELLSLDPTFFKVEFPGLKAKEKVKITSESFGECLGPIQHNGSEALIFSPDVTGHEGGVATLTVARRTAQKIKCEIPWGKALFKGYSVPNFFRP